MVRILVPLTAVVIAGALSVTAAVAVLDHRRTAEWNTFISNAMRADSSGPMVTSEIVREVPVHGSHLRSDAPQEFLYVNGVGSEPTSPINLVSEGLWLVKIRFADDEPPDVDTIPSVSLTSVSGSGGIAWSGDWWNRIYVTGDSDWALILGERMAVFTRGEVVVHISDLPDDVAWWVEFERLGEFKQP
ncbi:MAG: hypothetical protein OXG09_00055 [Chloroflexi bacterium]|nr:hypothetical protein [Chloroflexota bacterium]